MSVAPSTSTTDNSAGPAGGSANPTASRSRVRAEGLSALSFAAMGAAAGSTGACMGIGAALLAVPHVLGWYLAQHELVRFDALEGASAARVVRRMFVAPAMALLALLGLFIFAQGVFDVKWASFVWEGLPSETIAGRTYAWPGVYAAEFVEHDNAGGRSWYATGGPYVPLPDDSPAEAAARVVAYLHDRYDVAADHAHVEEVFDATRDTPPPERLRAHGDDVHPYTAGMAALEDEYSGAVLRALALRTVAVASAILITASLLIRIGIGRPPAWVGGKLFGSAFTIAGICFLAAVWWTDFGYAVFQAAVPLFRFHAQHVVPVTAAVLALSGFLLVSAHRRAKALAAELSRPA